MSKVHYNHLTFYFGNINSVAEFVSDLQTVNSAAELTESLSDPGIASYVICWMRLVASAELQRQPDFYINFLPEVGSVQDFCRRVSHFTFQRKPTWIKPKWTLNRHFEQTGSNSGFRTVRSRTIRFRSNPNLLETASCGKTRLDPGPAVVVMLTFVLVGGRATRCGYWSCCDHGLVDRSGSAGSCRLPWTTNRRAPNNQLLQWRCENQSVISAGPLWYSVFSVVTRVQCLSIATTSPLITHRDCTHGHGIN